MPGEPTLLALWRALTSLSEGAAVLPGMGFTAAVFPAWAPLNNAIVDEPAAAPAVASVYRDAAIRQWALWVRSPHTEFTNGTHEHPVVGCIRDTTTVVMQAELTAGLRTSDDVRRTSAIAAADMGDAGSPAADLPAAEQVPGLDGWAFVHEGQVRATAWSYRLGTDCGVYAVETAPAWRRRGFGRALTEHVLADAVGRGARTASLQSTELGRPLYTRLGFTAVGRYEEWVPEHAGLEQ